MRCNGCGADLPTGSRFCSYCGAAQHIACAACSHANPPDAKFCAQCGARLGGGEPAPSGGTPAAAAGERRQVTIMFCDLVGSTALSTALDPEDLRELLARYHAAVAATVGRYDGFVAKYMGDGVLVYFGYPRAHEDDAEQAVRAALAVGASIRELGDSQNHPLTRPPQGGERKQEPGLTGREASPNVPAPPLGRAPIAQARWGPDGEGRRGGGLAAAGPLQVRIGIATGLVVVGDLIGAGSAQEQAIVGETPNLAARLQALAEPDAIVIAESTRRQIGALFDLADLGPQALKGFAEPQHAFRVLGENRALGRFEALRSRATPLVGRAEELDLLLRRWAQANSGSGRVVLISAEPGIGKSRLAEALAERIAAEPHDAASDAQAHRAPVRLRYFCSPHHQDSALYPIIAQMERAAGCARDDTPEEKLEKLRALLAPAPELHGVLDPPPGASYASPRRKPGSTEPSNPRVPGYDGVLGQPASLPPEDLALIAELHALPTDFAPKLDVTPQKKKEKTFAALLRQVERLAQRQPVLMIFEDIHWIDPSSRELLDRTIEGIAGWPVLLLATFRPEFVPPWIGQPHVTLLTLARLERRDTAAMVATIAGNAVLPPDIVREIAERTDGVPLFVEELTKAVLESGAQGAAALSAVPHPALSVPATLYASLMARLDRLGPAAKDLAQRGAAIGREFGYDLLASIADLPGPQLCEALDRLANSGLLLARGTPPQATYLFKHALLQDAAYATLLRGGRRALHGRIAEALEARPSDAQPELLAYHFAEAGLAQRAVDYLLKAGQQTLARSAMREAEALLRRGLALLAGVSDSDKREEYELDLQILLGRTMIATRGFTASAVSDAYDRARQLCDRLGRRPDRLLPILYGQWIGSRGVQEQKDRAAEIRQLGEERHDDVARALGCNALGWACLHLGGFRAALGYLEEAFGAPRSASSGTVRAVRSRGHAGLRPRSFVVRSYLVRVFGPSRRSERRSSGRGAPPGPWTELKRHQNCNVMSGRANIADGGSQDR